MDDKLPSPDGSDSSAGLGLAPERANDSGETPCIVRWFVKTPAGWLGAWNVEAFDAAAKIARVPQEAEIECLREAMTRCVDNVERWLRTDESASAEESRAIYEQMCAALGREPIDPNALSDEEAADCGLLSELKA